MFKKSARGLTGRILDSMIEARRRQVQPYINGALVMLDDERLRALGHDRKQLVRQGRADYPL